MNEQRIMVESGWQSKAASILRSLIFLSGIYQTFFGEIEWGILTLIIYALITAPGFFTGNYIKRFPIEIEIILFLMVLLQFILGEINNFYTEVPFYDKIVHYMIPMFLGIIGFLIFYTMHFTGKLNTSTGAMMLIIIFLTLGIGAAWEIFEYGSDVLLYPLIPGWHHFQGNAQQDAITDTMTDLIVDTLGAIFGSFIGLWYFRRSKSETSRQKELITEVDEIIYRTNHKPSAAKKSD